MASTSLGLRMYRCVMLNGGAGNRSLTFVRWLLRVGFSTGEPLLPKPGKFEAVKVHSVTRLIEY
jgi:hypothetical protein